MSSKELSGKSSGTHAVLFCLCALFASPLWLGCENNQTAVEIKVPIDPIGPIDPIETPLAATKTVSPTPSHLSCDISGLSEIPPEFPVPGELRGKVDFWFQVFAKWPSDHVAIHDSRQLNVVYRLVKSDSSRSPQVTKAKAEIKLALSSLDKKRPTSTEGLSAVEREVFLAFGDNRDPQRFARAGSLRTQKGLADRFAAAVSTSGLYRAEIESILVDRDLPPELIAVAYIESLFDVNARSSAGAIGVWQFMPATAREYMKVNHVVDQRRDPIIASHAAARYLTTAKRKLTTWPLAITSYNYGMAGVARAVSKANTKDLSKLLVHYRHKRFGFAVKNYYAEFLAALALLNRQEQCFPHLTVQPPWQYEMVTLPKATTTTALIKAEALSRRVLESLNPALTPAAKQGKVLLPQGTRLRVPLGMKRHFSQAIALMPTPEPGATRIHRVRSGETVSRIAQLHGVSVNAVLALNNLGRNQKIYPNMKIRIPVQ